MSYLIALIFGLTIVAGPASLPTYLTEVDTTPAPVTAPLAPKVEVAPQVEVPTTPAPEVACEEDMPCWDSSTMGNKLSGPQVSSEVPNMEGDAYASYDALGVDPTTKEGMMLSYVASYTSAPTTLAANQFAVSSVQTEGLFHVLQWDILSEA